MHKGSNMKLQNNEGSEIVINQSRWIEYLVDWPLLLFPHICFPSSSSPCTVFMLTAQELAVPLFCLEGFLFGKISVLCALTSTLAKEVQLFRGVLGIYSGFFAIYLQCPSKESRTASIVFYVLCLLYILSTVSVVSDLLAAIIGVSDNPICKNINFY